MRILIVEDNPLLGTGLQSALQTAGFNVAWVTDGLSALNILAQETFLAIVLDLGLPDISGLEVMHTVRAGRTKIPILILSARDSTHDKVECFNAGADDYLSKSTDVEELVARLRSLIRRSGQNGTYTYFDLLLDLDARTVSQKGELLTLSKFEFEILSLLIMHAGKVVTRKQIEQAMYGIGKSKASNSIVVHIHNLRVKVTSLQITSIRGVGYALTRLT